jgi:hypothetical protein
MILATRLLLILVSAFWGQIKVTYLDYTSTAALMVVSAPTLSVINTQYLTL